jgi:DNA repair protein RecN (Recombination protein N)
MLQSISIKNFALVEDIQLQFQSGLNILTGETGAGKSLILNAIGLLLGRRATRESIRSGAKRAIIEGQWKVTRQNPLWRDLEDYAVEPDQELIIRREVNERGISRALVNDALVPLQTISKVTDWLVDLHGQHQHQLLLNAESHILFFDEVMLAKEKRVQTAEAYQAVLQSRENFARVRADLQQSENRREEAQAIYDELLTAKLFTGEYEDLQTELKQLENKEEIAVLYEKAASLIEEAENGLRHRRQHLLDVLARLATFIPEMDKLRAELVAVDSTYTEISAMADRSRMDIDFDPQEVEKMRHRQQQLRALQKKYNLDENGLIALCKQQEANLKQLNSADKNLAAAENDYRQKREAFGVLAGELSQLRQAQREPLAKAFRNALAKLGMPKPRCR